MKSTEDRRVRSSDEMVERRIDGRIKMCWSGIEFDCCQGEVFVVAIWSASGTRKSVSLADSLALRRNVFCKTGREKKSEDATRGVLIPSQRKRGDRKPGSGRLGPRFFFLFCGCAYKTMTQKSTPREQRRAGEGASRMVVETETSAVV